MVVPHTVNCGVNIWPDNFPPRSIPKDLETRSRTDTCMSMSTSALFLIAEKAEMSSDRIIRDSQKAEMSSNFYQEMNG